MIRSHLNSTLTVQSASDTHSHTRELTVVCMLEACNIHSNYIHTQGHWFWICRHGQSSPWSNTLGAFSSLWPDTHASQTHGFGITSWRENSFLARRCKCAGLQSVCVCLVYLAWQNRCISMCVSALRSVLLSFFRARQQSFTSSLSHVQLV